MKSGANYLIIGIMALLAVAAEGFTVADADAIMASHEKAFYRERDGRAWFKETTDGKVVSFWMRAEQMEMVLDAYDRTGEMRYLDRFEKLFTGFIEDHGSDWRDNDFNDDIMWMVIACVRAHLLTERLEYLVVAKRNFDLCYERAWSEDLGGGLWWKTDNRTKNACVNGPGSIAASLLAKATGDRGYGEKARAMFEWERDVLVDAETGRVYDHIENSGRLGRASFSYNQGTFVGAANLLGEVKSAKSAALFTINEMSRDGLLPGYGETGDGGGFNGICLRWIARFVYERREEATFEGWLQKNAEAAWEVRRKSDGLSWCHWDKPTPEGVRHSWGCSSSVVALQVVRPEK